MNKTGVIENAISPVIVLLNKMQEAENLPNDEADKYIENKVDEILVFLGGEPVKTKTMNDLENPGGTNIHNHQSGVK